MICHVCGKLVAPAEAAAYLNRCEDCWSGGGPMSKRHPQGAAESYSGSRFGDNPPWSIFQPGRVIRKDSHNG